MSELAWWITALTMLGAGFISILFIIRLGELEAKRFQSELSQLNCESRIREVREEVWNPLISILSEASRLTRPFKDLFELSEDEFLELLSKMRESALDIEQITGSNLGVPARLLIDVMSEDPDTIEAARSDLILAARKLFGYEAGEQAR